MKSLLLKLSLVALILFVPTSSNAQEFQGKAFYVSKSKMTLGKWGARLSEAQKKQIQGRLKNRLEKTYILSFNKQESMFLEEEKIDAVSGATDSWGGYFSRGDQYKNIKDDQLVQSQEFYGKRFLVKDELYRIQWNLGEETKQIGQYTSYKATASVPYSELAWYDFSWSNLRSDNKEKADTIKTDTEKPAVKMVEIEAWYTLQIPVAQGPAEFWGLPGLILEVSSGNTTMLCTKIEINPEEKITIKAPSKGLEITKSNYAETVQKKMIEMRDNRMGRRRSR